MMGRMVTGLMGNPSSQSFLFLGREAKVMGIFVPLKRVDWAGGSPSTAPSAYCWVWAPSMESGMTADRELTC
jgi:hypothetical protein